MSSTIRRLSAMIVVLAIALPLGWIFRHRIWHFHFKWRSHTLVRLEISPAVLRVPQGATRWLRPVGVYRDGRRVESPAKLSWTVSEPVVARVSPEGQMQALSTGSAQVRCKLEGETAELRIEVLPPAAVALAILPSAISMHVGQQLPLAALVTWSNNRQEPADSSVTWKVRDPRLARISAKGEIIALVPGMTTIEANLDNPVGTVSSAATVSIEAKGAVPGVYTYRYDNTQAGQNRQEFVLTPQNVRSGTFGKLFETPVDGFVYGQPLFAPSVNISSHGIHNVLYVATENNSLYALDADTGKELYRKSLGTPVPESMLPCGDMGPNIGVTGTPVIDPESKTLYVAARTYENGVNRFELHAINIASGEEQPGSPVEISASVPASGASSRKSMIVFDAGQQLQRPGLVLSDHRVYLAFGSLCDQGPFHGWLLAYDERTLSPSGAFLVTPNGHHGGIWQAGSAPIVDANGNIYVITGDGEFDADEGGLDYSDSFLKFRPFSGKAEIPEDYFTPFDQDEMEIGNLDLGSTGPILLPDQPGQHPHLLFGSGKNSGFYLLDRDELGHHRKSGNEQIVQYMPNGMPEKVHTTPAYWEGERSMWLYVSCVEGTLRAFPFENGKFAESFSSETHNTFSYPGATIVVSSNGSRNGIVWALDRSKGALYAYDATDLSRELYNSEQAKGGRDRAEKGVQFYVPMVANGRVYFGGRGRIHGFGLLH